MGAPCMAIHCAGADIKSLMEKILMDVKANATGYLETLGENSYSLFMAVKARVERKESGIGKHVEMLLSSRRQLYTSQSPNKLTFKRVKYVSFFDYYMSVRP